MNKTSSVFKMAGTGAAALAAAGWLHAAQAMRPTGEAVVAAMTGRAQVRVYTAPVHQGRTELRDLNEGMAVGEQTRVQTGRDGRLCLVCSPGAILCVAPETEFSFDQLRHTADGLPQTEDDLIRRIHLTLRKGRIRVQAGEPMATMDIRIATPAGVAAAQGGSFAAAEDDQGRWHIYCDAGEVRIEPRDGTAVTVGAGEAARFWLEETDEVRLEREGVDVEAELHQFELCNAYFADLEPFIESGRPFDRAGLERYLGARGPVMSLDNGALVTDVSPSIRTEVAVPAAVPPGMAPGSERGERWSRDRIWTWYEQLGTVKGVNYIPRTAVNSVEMWMEETFDPGTIDEELGWAQAAGYTAIRVQLQFVVWQADSGGFLDRVDKLMELAAKHGLRVVPVLFDDLNLAASAPVAGGQPDPVPGVHNSRWVPSPSGEAVTDRGQWPELERYVKDVMGRFKSDDRVLYWDLYNTAGNNGLWEESLPLMDRTFDWARSVGAAQPLAVAAWREFGSAMAARKLERSDLVTFQSFDNVESVEARLQMLQRLDRPIICSDWLLRQAGNNFDKILPLFAAYRVGWFNHGLVAGRTQTFLQQERYRSAENPDLWQHDVLRDDGKPYDERELELIQGFRFLDTP